MRGKANCDKIAIENPGITPAYAGKRNHANSCNVLETGSPPPMRGKGVAYRGDNIVDRITPAYAGKSEFRKLGHNAYRDHPRLCGEKTSPLIPKISPVGSPPPMRGKANNGSYNFVLNGITPAYAGKSKKFWIVVIFIEDHPRLCGEK